MPQYEVEITGESPQRLRSRNVEDAVRRAGLAEATVEDDPDLHGWHAVTASGEEVARVREHNRMRFRRD